MQRRAAQGNEARGILGRVGRAIYVEFLDVEPPQAGNKMEAMEAVERVEGFFGGWSLHKAIWLGGDEDSCLNLFDPPELDFRVAPRACRPNMSMTAAALRTTSRPRRGLLLARWLRVPSQASHWNWRRHSLIVDGRQRPEVGLSGQAASIFAGPGVGEASRAG